MKHAYLNKILLAIILILPAIASQAQQTDDVLNLLIKKNLVSQQEADSIRADIALKEQAKKDKDKSNQHTVIIGSKALQISGLIQTEYEGFQQTTATSPAINSTFLLHRARLDIKGDILNGWSYEAYTEFAGANPKLLDAYSSYKIADYLKFTAGQFKVPFSLESLYSDSQLEFIDRSQVVNALAGRSADIIGNQNGRDIGIQVGGSFAKLNDVYLFDYTFGLFNGAGYDVTTDNNNHKDIAGRLAIHPLANLSIAADFYKGTAFYAIGTAKAANHARNRQGIDGRYVIGALSLQAEYDKGTDATTGKHGWYGQAAYFVLPKKLQIAAKYDTFDPNEESTKTVTSNYYEGAVNYFFNDWAKLALNYVDRREPSGLLQVKNDIFEAQLQLTF